MKQQQIYDISIIGAGPAGLTAAIYGQRANLKTCLIEKSAPGGKMVNTAKIENYPGYSEINGPDLAIEMFTQATSLGSEYIAGNAIKIDYDAKYKIISLEDGTKIKSKAIIIAIGMENKKLAIPGEDRLYGHGVSYCAICDGMFFKDQPIAVIGSGNSACEESIYLSEIGSQIYLIVRGNHLKAEAHTINLLKQNPKIKVLFNTKPIEIVGEKAVEKLIVQDQEQTYGLDVKAVFPFIGLIAKNIDNSLAINSQNNFMIVDNDMQTNIEGIFAAGDINLKKFRQISTAINDGTIAALNAKEYILNNFN